MFATTLDPRARRTVAPWLAVVLFVSLAASAGCGSSQPAADRAETSTLDVADAASSFEAQVEATCMALDARVEPVIGRLIASRTATPEDMRTALGTVVAAARDQVEQLGEIDPPAEHQTSFGRYVAALGAAATEIERSIGVAQLDDVVGEGAPSPFFAAEAQADAMGIHRSCGSGEATADEPLTTSERRDAARVEVVATEYRWSVPTSVAAGPTVLAFRNDGQDLHELFLVELVDGAEPVAAIDAAVARLESGEPQTEQPPEVARRLGVARGGPDAVAELAVDLSPGTYVMLCLLPDADGVSHAAKGMTAWFEATA